MKLLLTKKIPIINLLRLVMAAAVIWYVFCLFSSPGTGSKQVDISFPPGSGIRKLASDLKSGGVIYSSWHFVLVSRLRGVANNLKAGDYRISDAMTPVQILSKIARGDVDYKKFTLPEGYSIYQAAELLEQKGIFKKSVFLEACHDRELLSRLGVSADSVEGYLYPATYNLGAAETAEKLIEKMYRQFEKEIVEKNWGRSDGNSLHKIITLASVVEKEAVTASEKPLIASVFYNRLRLGMPLQSDPTAVYGVRAFAGKVKKADILRSSRYNTYQIKGLPPGPIGNPGAESIKAAITPASSQYLYFVARQDGTHQFSKTLAEHNSAVKKYLK